MQLQRAYQIVDTKVVTLADTAQDIAIGGRVFMIANSGAEPIYIRPAELGVADETTGFMIAAGQTLPQYFSSDVLSAVSTATGSTLSLLLLDV